MRAVFFLAAEMYFFLLKTIAESHDQPKESDLDALI